MIVWQEKGADIMAKEDSIKKKRRRAFIYIVLATTRIKFKVNVEEDKEKLDLLNVVNMNETRVKLTVKGLDKEKYINLANSQLENLNLTNKRFENSESTKIFAYKNNREFLEEICLSNDNMEVTINSKNDELIIERKI